MAKNAVDIDQVVGLIQALAPAMDVGAIQTAVTSWLNNHPEATTTVTDGSITEAKLAAAVAQKLGLISSLSDEIDGIDSDVTDLKSATSKAENEIASLYITGKNVLDPSQIDENTLLSGAGTTVESSDYMTCGYIRISNGQSITFNRIRKFIAFDTNKDAISESFRDKPLQNFTYTATADGFVRASVANLYGATWQAEYGNTSTPFEAYQRFLAIDLGDAPLEQVADLIAETNATYLIEDITPSTGYTDNVFIRWDTGGTSSNSSYRAFRLLPVEKYTHILYTRIVLATDAQSNAGMAFIGENGYISGQQRLVGSELQYIPTLIAVPEGAITANFSERKDLTGFSIKGVRKIDIKDIAKKSNILFGKKWAVLGDSFTNGALANTIGVGKYANERIVYPYIIGNRNEMQILSFFDGGRTLAFPAQPGSFVNSVTCPTANYYYQNIPEDVDYITIYLGINDEHHAPGSSGDDGEDNTGVIPIGTVDDVTTETYFGAWNVVLTWLISNRPNAHIGIIVTNGIQSNDNYRQGQIAIAHKYGIPYIDLNGDTRTPAMLRTSNPDISDVIKTALIQKWAVDPATNTHPNDAAHIFESSFIENFLRSI